MIRVLVSENQPGDTERLLQGLAESRDLQVVGLTRDGLETAQMIARLHPDVALVRAQMPGMDGFQTCRMALLVSPETACLLVFDTAAAAEGLREEAMRSGARGLTDLTADAAQLAGVIAELVKLQQHQEGDDFRLVTDPARMPVTISVTGAKGGVGKTTVATNLAVTLQQRYPNEVVLVDFVGQYSDVNLLLDLPTNGSLVDLAEYEELDAEVLNPRLSRHGSGLRILAGASGPQSMEAASSISLPLVANLMGALRRDFRFVVLDMPALLPPLSRYIFLRSSAIVVVTCLRELSSMRNTGALLASLLTGQVPPERIQLVVNRRQASDPFGVADLRQATQHPVALELPQAPEALAALNSGVPFVLSKPMAPVSRGIGRLADLLVSAGPTTG